MDLYEWRDHKNYKKSTIFWHVMTCSRARINQCFRGMYCLHLQVEVSQSSNQHAQWTAHISNTAVNSYNIWSCHGSEDWYCGLLSCDTIQCGHLLPVFWSNLLLPVPWKCRYLSTRLHGVTTYNTVILNLTYLMTNNKVNDVKYLNIHWTYPSGR